ncbi:FAD-dependent oxidoreductase [Chitinophaga sp. GCM10012297]|uniref:FAD-dependent oxidoreductase n=1 Tax=Chitinophaga chungangae TaxID=2821488 RepID=A0ABS3YHV8_9BACT|nr:FAD-dependent oxidoreductase [Chitinophaga chungangae]MBO9154271.1 FAD-dependent oxidoreductase [Chitinophaga chungangae]
MKTSNIISVILLSFCLQTATAQHKVDVCVFGGSSAGVIAAYTAKKAGRSVLLVEPGKYLGGLTTGGLGYTDIGNKYAIRGLSLEFYRQMGRHYGKFEQWVFEPHVADSIYKDYVKKGGFEVLFNHRLSGASKENGAIREIQLSSGGATVTVAAKMFIDCTYEGDLMAKAGVSYTVGREGNEVYNETWNGVQLLDGHQFPDGIDPYKVPGDPSSGLLWGISPAPLGPKGSGNKMVQAYNYRICLTSDPANMIPITQPDNYDPSRYELLVRLMKAWPERTRLNDYFIWSGMPNKKTDINNRNGFSTDMIGMNYDYPEASYEQRETIVQQHIDYTKGLLYFCSSDPRVPAAMREEIKKWGYPKDEYVNNGHWSPQLYVREARRMIGAYVMTQANCTGKEVVPDGIGMAAYTMDSHNTQRIVVRKNGKDMVKNEGNVEVHGFPPYPVSYRALIPKENECSNLLVPVCLSASHIAYGSIRMEPVFMALAQASAVAADLAIDKNIPVQKVDAAQVSNRLAENPLADGRLGDILVDNAAADVKKEGEWKTVKGHGSYGPDMLTAEKDAKVTFAPAVRKKGRYAIYMYYPRLKNNAAVTNVKVTSGKHEELVTVKAEDVKVVGQTSGEWVKLGTFDIRKGNSTYVEISAANNTEGVVVADAVIFVPEKR